MLSRERFENYIDLHFEINDTTNIRYNNFRIQMPEKNCSAIQLDKSILVFRIDMKSIGHLYVTLRNLSHELRVSISCDRSEYTFITFFKLYIYSLRG